MKDKKILKRCIVVLLGIICNAVLGCAAAAMELPVRLDMIGTCAAAVYAGPVGALLSGVVGEAIICLVSDISFLDLARAAAVSILIGLVARRGAFRNISNSVILSFWTAILGTVVSMITDTVFNGGYSGNIWGDSIVDMLIWRGTPFILASAAGEALICFIDAQVCIILSYFFASMITKRVSHRSGSALALIICTGIVLSYAAPIYSYSLNDMFSDNFVSVVYDNTNGMMITGANTVEQTEDGYLWIGSYAGLSRYDGNSFEFIREGRIVSIMDMMSDSNGRLWIGTNDAGIVINDHSRYTYIDDNHGLPSRSVRCFAEDSRGNVYAGTTDRICRIDSENNVYVLDSEMTFVKSMAVSDDIIAAVDNTGNLGFIDSDKVIPFGSSDEQFWSAAALSEGGFAVGTGTGMITFITYKDGNPNVTGSAEVTDSEIISLMEDSSGRLWFGTQKGFGYIDKGGIPHTVSNSFSSIEKFFEDYQGNIWGASSIHGVAKLSPTSFVDIFEKSGCESAVVNAVGYYNGDFYCGTDNGLVILDGNTFASKSNDITEMIDDGRVRSIFVDSKGELWICTYTENGLICFDGMNITCFNTSCGTTSDRFRCVTELSDGTIAAGTTDGINLICDGKLAGTISAEDGLGNSQVLCAVEGNDGNLWAGTDGAGVYVISEGSIIGHYTSDDGLSSDIVMKIVPHDDGTFFVASNSICHMNNNGKIIKIDKFPYFDNFDIIIRDETAYVVCSAGLYEAGLSDLCSDADTDYRLYNTSDGIMSSFNSNSVNYLTDEGILLICSNTGVTAFDRNDISEIPDVRFGITSVEFDNRIIAAEDDEITLPESTKHIAVYGSARNNALYDYKVRFFIQGSDEPLRVYNCGDIEPVIITDPDSSEYVIHFQILDSTGSTVLNEKLYVIKREMQMWENGWFKAYVVFAVFEILIFCFVSVITMILWARRKNEIERQSEELEKRVSEQTEEIRSQQQKTKDLFLSTVTALSDAVDAKDRYTSGHSKRVALYARILAERMGKSADEQDEIFRAGLLHDVGKIRIPVEIINKTGKLTDEEYDLIKIHPVTGYHILKNISESSLIAVGAKFHHERYDGNGYPSGLVGENIPEIARILGVADAYDAMASDRSYRKALPQEVVRSEIEKGKGKQFDPEIADIMLRMIDEDTEYSMKQADAKHTILAVDDEPINIKLITRFLDSEPMFDVVSAYSGAEAMEMLENNRIDLVLLDVMMPDMDGFEAFEMIKEKYDIPVVFMTGDRNPQTIIKAAEAGICDYITKPIQPLLLKEVIHSLLNRE